MPVDLSEHFKAYEEFVKTIDQVFERVRKEFPKEVFCREKCSDCCYALFDLTIIEALYINHRFRQAFSGTEKIRLIDEAAKIDRALVKLKREAYREVKEGADEIELLGKMSMERMRCPLLGPDNLCILYEARPITCRLYGIPTATAGKSHICGRTNFVQGNPYPTVDMDAVYGKLQLLSAQLVKEIGATNVKLCEMLIPVSMALITDFNEEYLGIDTLGNK